MELILQPEDSSICGQCCVAMIAGKTISEVISLMKTKGGTNTKQVASALRLYGYPVELKAERINKKTELPDLCIVKLTYFWRPNTGHWIVYNKGEVFCPGWGRYPYQKHFEKSPSGCYWGKPTSFIRVPLPGNEA